MLYDGDCAFCTRCVVFVRKHVATDATIVAWQATDLDQLGVSAAECVEAVQWIDPPRPRLAGPAAVAALLRSSTLRWRWLGRLLGTAPMLALAQPVYRWV